MGTEDNYHLVDGSNTTVDGDSRCLTVDASFVIVRGLTCINQTNTPVRVEDPNTDVLLDGLDISNFDFVNKTAGEDNAFVIELGVNDGDQNSHRIVIQKTHIHDSQWGLDTESWGSGLFGIFTRDEQGGNHVFRFNTLTGSDEYGFRDPIGGVGNSSKYGFPGSDSDIYGNYIANSGDDGIEAEGGGENVRIWGNYLELYGVGIAIATMQKGPTYVFRNVGGRIDALGLGEGEKVGYIKTGTRFQDGCPECVEADDAHGRHYLYHNTFVEIPGTEGDFVSRTNNWGGGPKAQTSANNIWQAADGFDGLQDSVCFFRSSSRAGTDG